MMVHNYAGAVFFLCKKVFIMKNDAGVWNFPKGFIANAELPVEVALRRIYEETGINPEVISLSGDSYHNFFSVSQDNDVCNERTWNIKPVCNKVTWYIMSTPDENYIIDKKYKLDEVGFYSLEIAEKMLKCSQDISLLNIAYRKLNEILMC